MHSVHGFFRIPRSSHHIVETITKIGAEHTRHDVDEKLSGIWNGTVAAAETAQYIVHVNREEGEVTNGKRERGNAMFVAAFPSIPTP